MASEITKGTKVLVPATVGKVFVPMGRNYEMVWLTEGRVDFLPSQLFPLDDLREVLRATRFRMLDGLSDDEALRDRIDALLARLGEG